MRWQAGETTCARGTLATTTLRSMMSTRLAFTVTSSPCSAACLPSFGAVPSTRPPCGGSSRITLQGSVTETDTGACEISGDVTLDSTPLCGQFSVAVLCTTGSSGVAIDSTNPIRPAIVATQRATLTSRRISPARSGSTLAKTADEPLARRASEPVMAAL